MFKKFFQRKPKASDKDRQLEHINTLDSSSPQHLSQLLELAKSDPDPNVRSAAASRIGLRDCLAGLLKHEQDTVVRSRLIKLLFNQCTDDAAVEIATNLLRHADDDTGRIALLADVHQPAAATFIAARIQDPQALVQTAVEHKISRVRLAAAQQLQDETQLLDLAHRSRDKSVNQWVRARLKELKEQRQQQALQQEQIDKLLDDCQQLSTSENPLDYRQRQSRLQTRMEELKTQLTDHQQSQALNLLKQCSAKAEELEQAVREPVNPPPVAKTPKVEAQEEPTVEDPTASAREQLAADLNALLQSSETMDVDAIEQQLNTSRTAWQALGEDQQGHTFHQVTKQLQDAASSQLYLQQNSDALTAFCKKSLDADLDDETLESLRSDTKDYLDVLRWPDNWQAPEALNALREFNKQSKDLFFQRREQTRKRAQQLDKKIHRMGDAVRRKNLRLANNLHREIEHAWKTIPDTDQRKLQQHLNKHLPEFEKLNDWHDYSANPKKEDLCEQMEALIDREQAPEARAESVKQLRNEWRTVTAANVKKDDPLWTRFNGAAEKAYAPCEPFFEKQRERQRKNLEKRERLTGELEQLLEGINWEEPPFDMLDKVLRTARAEWQQYSPVHFPDAKPCQKRFDTAMDKVHGALQQQRKSNAAERDLLIGRAAALSEVEDTDSAIAQALKLQDAWKAIGPVNPQAQRKQWRVFRKNMDAVFARRQAERDANNAQQNAQSEQVSALLDKLEALTKLPDEQLPQAQAESSELLNQIDEASQELPKRASASLARRQSALLDIIAKKQRELPMRRRAKTYADLSALAAQCHNVEQAVLNGETISPIDNSESQWRSLMLSRLELHNDIEKMRSSMSDNLESLEQLAIELEILAEVDTPEEFRGQRRAWQLDLLESGSPVSDGRTQEEQFFELLQRWHSVGAVSDQSRDALDKRLALASAPFAKLLDAGPQPTPPVVKVNSETEVLNSNDDQ